MPVVETDVLIVGSGPAGAAAALALSVYGVPHIVVTRYARLTRTPRAHITNQRTMEVLRDLGVGKDRFTLLTGIGGDAWLRAAESQQLDIATVVIGPGRQYEDPYDWARLGEISDGGALLVRPDGYVALRHADAAENGKHLLTDAVRRILGDG
ncbi:FAD-dependent monooxygenase [Streptomyces hokutonensis]|uniref:FAD-dependent monooxygenase n=1 Tax=Streptomyces hokutonensis TaxID=1306990 RepID=UPI0003681C8D